MNIAVKRWIITCIPIYVNVLQEGCKQWAQYLTKVQLICSFSSLASRENKKKLMKYYDLEVTCWKKLYQVLEDITADRRTDSMTDRTKNITLQIFKRCVCVWGGYKVKPYTQISRRVKNKSDPGTITIFISA